MRTTAIACAVIAACMFGAKAQGQDTAKPHLLALQPYLSLTTIKLPPAAPSLCSAGMSLTLRVTDDTYTFLNYLAHINGEHGTHVANQFGLGGARQIHGSAKGGGWVRLAENIVFFPRIGRYSNRFALLPSLGYQAKSETHVFVGLDAAFGIGFQSPTRQLPNAGTRSDFVYAVSLNVGYEIPL
ncbi:MAG: hypothetical protein RLZZ324_144 [Candidatus Parcubacteria bacterium]|jgi:hypothetical protein